MTSETKATDRRVQRTRDLLLNALPQLLMERGYEQLTIQHLLDRAGVGRATFYSHFESKDDLLVCSIGRLRHLLVTHGKRTARARFGFSLAYFEHLDTHRAIYRMTVARDNEITVQREFRRMLRALVTQDITTRRKPTDTEALAIEFVVSAFWSTTVWWIDSGSSLTAAQIDAHFERLTMRGLNLALQDPQFG